MYCDFKSVDRARKLLAKACNDATEPHEAKTFARGFANHLNRAGLTFDDISFGAHAPLSNQEIILQAEKSTLERRLQDQGHELTLMRQCAEEHIRANRGLRSSKTRLRNRYDSLKAEYLDLQARYKALRAENEALRAQVEVAATEPTVFDPTSVTSDTFEQYMSFEAFMDKARACYSRDHWKAAFAFEAGISLKEFAAWQTVGVLPVWLASKLDSLTEQQRAAASRKHWSEAERMRLRRLAEQGRPDCEIARALTQEFGRRIFESGVTRQRRHLLRRSGFEGGLRGKQNDRATVRPARE